MARRPVQGNPDGAFVFSGIWILKRHGCCRIESLHRSSSNPSNGLAATMFCDGDVAQSDGRVYDGAARSQ